MANNMYTKLFMQVNKLFKEDYLLRDNIPEDILNWVYHYYDIKLEGKLLRIDAIPDMDVYIIKDNNLTPEQYGMDTILLDNKPCKLIVISKNFLEREIYDVQVFLCHMYKVILKDLFKTYESDTGLYTLNLIAPYILTINTMRLFGLTFTYKDIEEYNIDISQILIKSCDYTIEDLLDNGLVLRLFREQDNKVEE